jgi:DNA mismatch repair protein MutS
MTETPFAKMIREARAANPDCLCLFRIGDFYELFYDDATVAAKVLGLTLTTRDRGPNPVPMTGFPYHQLDAYVGKLVAAGYRVAIVENS